MSGVQANPYTPTSAIGAQTVSATITALGAAALAIGGLVAGAFITRALLGIGRGSTPSLVGDSGSLMVGSQDAAWALESSVGTDTSSSASDTRWIWVVHDLLAGTYIDSSTGDFSDPEAARADLAAYGLGKGWIFG